MKQLVLLGTHRHANAVTVPWGGHRQPSRRVCMYARHVRMYASRGAPTVVEAPREDLESLEHDKAGDDSVGRSDGGDAAILGRS